MSTPDLNVLAATEISIEIDLEVLEAFVTGRVVLNSLGNPWQKLESGRWAGIGTRSVDAADLLAFGPLQLVPAFRPDNASTEMLFEHACEVMTDALVWDEKIAGLLGIELGPDKDLGDRIEATIAQLVAAAELPTQTTTNLDLAPLKPEIAAAVQRLRSDIEPGPFQTINGWAHAVPLEQRDAIRVVLAENRYLREQWKVTERTTLLQEIEGLRRELTAAQAATPV